MSSTIDFYFAGFIKMLAALAPWGSTFSQVLFFFLLVGTCVDELI
jgi:hypothetical protein